jgi:hypothetical protein
MSPLLIRAQYSGNGSVRFVLYGLALGAMLAFYI